LLADAALGNERPRRLKPAARGKTPLEASSRNAIYRTITMIETHTNDIALALPSAITGPLVIADGSDAASYIKIDPALAVISAAGTARPTRRRMAGFSRAAGSTTATVMGTAMAARSVGTSADGGFHAHAMRVPEDMDLTQPGRVLVLLRPTVSSLGGALVVRTEAVVTYGKDGDATVADQIVTYDWTTPPSWSTAPKLVLIDGGSGYTFAGGTFEADDVLALRVRLVRSAIQDTFDQPVDLAEAAIIEYTAKGYL
jgi:hypothetical protein